MQRHHRRRNIIKFFVTLFNLILFNYVIIYADKFEVKVENLPVRANFIETSANKDDALMAVRLDNVIIDGGNYDGNITYVIKPGDTLISIAQDVGTTVSNIRRVNNLSNNAEIRADGTVVGKNNIALHRLTITELPGIVIALDSTTSVSEFSKQYDLNEEDIKSLNNITDSKTILRAGDELFLTVSEKEAIAKGIIADPNPPVQVVVADVPATKPSTTVTKTNNTPTATTKPVVKSTINTVAPKAQIISTTVNGIIGYDKGTILSSWFQKDYGYAGFVAGYCTSYAAARRPDIFNNPDLRFRGNANAWYANAKAAGNAVGTTPKVGAIVVFAPGRGASSYGHVGIVEEVNSGNGTIVISDMNYQGRNIVTKRVVDNALPIGYIY